MKKTYLLLLGFITFGFFACKQSVYLTITEPPAIYLTPDYTMVSVVNRSTNSGNSKLIEILENGVSLEGDLDKKAAAKTIDGVVNRLGSNPQLIKVSVLDSMSVMNGSVNEFPAALSWTDVDALCRANNSRLLFALEVYDTDTRVAYSTQKVNQNTPLGNIPLLRHIATVTTVVKMGWRIYDPSQKIILDEFRMTNQVTNTGSGITPVNALAAVINRDQTVLDLSRRMGESYAERLLEHQIRVWRTYFKTGSSNLRMARRKAQVNDWKGASDLWLKDMNNSQKRKILGRATYNMAIYEEVNGNLEQALVHARKAYGDYNIKQARTYVIELERRLNNQQFIK